MTTKTIVATLEDTERARVVVWDLMQDTGCLDEVKGMDVPELTRYIAGGIARERDRVEAESIIDGPPLPKYHDLLEALSTRFGIPGSPTFDSAMDWIENRYERKVP